MTIDDISDEISKFPLIYSYYKKNNEQGQWNFIECMLKVPSPQDCPGFVYGFMDEK